MYLFHLFNNNIYISVLDTPYYLLQLGESYDYCMKITSDRISLTGKGKPWQNTLRINHYARSLEKFDMKHSAWQTGGSSHRTFKIKDYLSRSVGWFVDRHALAFSCQLREILMNTTGIMEYLRPGDNWYRNPEFRKPMKAAFKGRREANKVSDNTHIITHTTHKS
jgi:hypothetical protein